MSVQRNLGNAKLNNDRHYSCQTKLIMLNCPLVYLIQKHIKSVFIEQKWSVFLKRLLSTFLTHQPFHLCNFYKSAVLFQHLSITVIKMTDQIFWKDNNENTGHKRQVKRDHLQLITKNKRNFKALHGKTLQDKWLKKSWVLYDFYSYLSHQEAFDLAKIHQTIRVSVGAWRTLPTLKLLRSVGFWERESTKGCLTWLFLNLMLKHIVLFMKHRRGSDDKGSNTSWAGFCWRNDWLEICQITDKEKKR